MLSRYYLGMPSSESAVSVLLASPFAEDREAFLLAFKEYNLDWTLLPACDCREAWVVLHQRDVDVVIADAGSGDGFEWRELMDEITAMRTHQPVIVCSRTADESLWAEVLNLGGFDVLAKPFDAEELVRVIAMAVRHGRQMRAATAKYLGDWAPPGAGSVRLLPVRDRAHRVA